MKTLLLFVVMLECVKVVMPLLLWLKSLITLNIQPYNLSTPSFMPLRNPYVLQIWFAPVISVQQGEELLWQLPKARLLLQK